MSVNEIQDLCAVASGVRMDNTACPFPCPEQVPSIIDAFYHGKLIIFRNTGGDYCETEIRNSI